MARDRLTASWRVPASLSGLSLGGAGNPFRFLLFSKRATMSQQNPYLAPQSPLSGGGVPMANSALPARCWSWLMG